MQDSHYYQLNKISSPPLHPIKIVEQYIAVYSSISAVLLIQKIQLNEQPVVQYQ